MTFYIFLLENWEKRSDKTTDWEIIILLQFKAQLFVLLFFIFIKPLLFPNFRLLSHF